MRMKRFHLYIVIPVLLLSPINLSAQELIAEYHRPLQKDSLSAYKLPYISMTDSGRNCIWDFSHISIDNAEEIEINYFSPDNIDTFHIGLHREHANYYYHYTQDTLWLTAYETSHTRVRYLLPMPMLRFPFAYGDSICGAFTSEGQYCHLLPLHSEGIIFTRADGIGKLILPNDTIDKTLRIHSRTLIREQLTMQSIAIEDRYYWVSPYYRYPLLESFNVLTIKSTDTISFSSSYYTPQEPIDIPAPKQKQIEKTPKVVDSLVTNVIYQPNPVHSDLQIHYSLTRQAQVYISLNYNGGITMYQSPLRTEEEGTHSVYVNMGGMPIGNYVVYIYADDTIISGNIIKY